MKFGPVAVAQAKGAILAHSLTVGGARWRKGRVLTGDDVAALQSAGMPQVIAARPDADDLPEDTAAAALGAALHGAEGLALSTAFTGRVNVTATHPGVARIAADRVLAANRVNPMITVATVPEWHQLDAGDMVATIKVISFAVPAADVAQAAALLGGALSVAPVKLRDAELIVTEVPGGAGEKGVPAIEARLQRLGIELSQVTVLPHRPEAISAALAKVQTDLALILTGSATSDIADVAPAALLACGGRVERFGMPVDPGNLLFLGDLRGKPVIGLPGCARSPALNGADWVLARVACGMPVTGDDIAAMAVGGLLKEIPTRPQPRRPR